LTITHCTVRNYTQAGIQFHPAGDTTFLIADTVASNNFAGIGVGVRDPGSAIGTLDHVSLYKNTTGIGVGGPAEVLAVDSTAANNLRDGFQVVSGAVLRLAHSGATDNFIGVNVAPGSLAESAGNNFIRGNSGTMFKVP
jgi:hypothetical protein